MLTLQLEQQCLFAVCLLDDLHSILCVILDTRGDLHPAHINTRQHTAAHPGTASRQYVIRPVTSQPVTSQHDGLFLIRSSLAANTVAGANMQAV
jgi:hypothetical protein